uniref:Uncharacterized protein n=1 Tax=Rhizophora mucronata TaxID=61149 RepID=A0A2P2JN79_RHIMU
MKFCKLSDSIANWHPIQSPLPFFLFTFFGRWIHTVK